MHELSAVQTIILQIVHIVVHDSWEEMSTQKSIELINKIAQVFFSSVTDLIKNMFVCITC